MTRPFVRLSLLSALLPLTACMTVGPDYRRPAVQMPARWHATTATAAPRLAGWWRGMGDPVLDRLIADGIAGSPDVAGAKARVRQAHALHASAGGALSPTLDGSGSSMRSGGDGAQTAGRSALGLATRWDIDLFGANRRGVEAAYYAAESAGEQLRSAHVALIGDIAAQYIRLRAIQARIAIAGRNAASQRRTVALTRSQMEVGQVAQVDLLSAETQAAATEAQIPGLRIEEAATLNALALLTGRSAGALAGTLAKPAPVPAVPRRVSAGIPAALLLSRPDIRAAERDYAAATAGIGQKQAALYPAVSLTGDIGLSGVNPGDLAKLSTIGWRFGPSVSLPLFHGGRLLADVDAAKAMRDQAFIAYRKAILTALGEVENASVSLNQNRLRVAQLRRIADNSRRLNDLMVEQYRIGTKTLLDVLTAQRNL